MTLNIRAATIVTLAVFAVMSFGTHADAQRKKKKKADEELVFEPVAVKRVPQSRTLQRAIKLYEENEDYYSASIEFFKVYKKLTKDALPSRQRAGFFLGKTLYNMGFYAASLAFFEEIADEGQSHPYHKATLRWLAALSNVLPESAKVLDKIGTYEPEDLEDASLAKVRDELYYLLGRQMFKSTQDSEGVADADKEKDEADKISRLDKALALFERVDENHPMYLRAKFMEGVTYVRQYKAKPAADAFKELLALSIDKPARFKKQRKELASLGHLARLNLARVFYSTRQYDTSIKHFELLPQGSGHWVEALFEASWAYFMKTNYSKALGNIHTLNAPYFENQFFPESTLLSSVVFYKYCLYDRATEMVAEFNEKYLPLRDSLREIAKKYDDNTDFYEYVLKIKSGKAGLDGDTRRMILGAISDNEIQKSFLWVEELARESKKFEASDKTWQTTDVGNKVLTELTVRDSIAQAEAGEGARNRITRLTKELSEHRRNGLKIQAQILEERTGQITEAAKGEKIKGSHKEDPIRIDDEHFMWKFNGEYWKDELGFYRFKIRSNCAKSKTNTN